MTARRPNSGFTLIEVVIGIALVAMLFGGMYMAYYTVQDVSANSAARQAIAAILNREAEIIRNLPYDDVGIQYGFPSGILPAVKTATSTQGIFRITTTVRNIDDPFDGTLGGTPNDTSPADYKLVEFSVTCETCQYMRPVGFTMSVAPKSLESASNNGSLFVNVFDAAGSPVATATVRVVNASTTPTIDLIDNTDVNGVLQLVGVPPSENSYQIFVSKPGYSSDQNYAASSTNPNPVKPYATVAAQSLTETSFAIDRTSSVSVRTRDPFCKAIGGGPFTVSGAKIIGTPSVLKFSLSTSTDGNGEVSLSNLEWDAYSFAYTGASHLVGTIPLAPLVLNPNSSATFDFILRPADPNALLVAVKDGQNGSPVSSSAVTIAAPGFESTQTTGLYDFSETDWSGGNYSGVSGVETTGGGITMAEGAEGYSTTTPAWLISNSVDLGSVSSGLRRISWSATTPGQTEVKFQIAVNNDNATWNFVGPNSDPGAYFTSPGEISFNDFRYFRYKAYLSTGNSAQTPVLNDIEIEFSGSCVPEGQTLFHGLTLGTYDVNVSAPGYALATTTATLTSPFQSLEVQVFP